mgnify:CR=1 FL=1
MKKNVAGQKIGAQLVSATDGSAFTGSVTVYVTGDAGTQAAGSVGSGACTHEGNGYHTYAPAQAETNYDLIAFTFTGTGAIPQTVQVFTSFPQTGDSFALIGATGSGLTSLATQASVNTIDDFLDTEVAAIKAKTDNLPAAPAATGDIPTAVENADALLGRNVSGGSSTGRTVKQALHVLRNKSAVAAGTLTVFDTDDATSSWTATVSSDAAADPITGIDPA